MSCQIGLLQGGLGALLGRFLRDYPEVRIALDATNRGVDVIEEGLDLAIRVRLPPDREFRAEGQNKISAKSHANRIRLYYSWLPAGAEYEVLGRNAT
jgi:hypothetical protein